MLCQRDGENVHGFVFIILFQKADIVLPVGFNLYVRGLYQHHCRIVKSVYVKLNVTSQLDNVAILTEFKCINRIMNNLIQ